jgi:hypothetical protein
MKRLEIVRRNLRCSRCKDSLNEAYEEYQELLRFLSKHLFFTRPDFYNKRRHGRSIKWYLYSLRSVITRDDRENMFELKHRISRILKSEFPRLESRIKVSLTESYEGGRRRDYAPGGGLIVSFKYHGEFNERARR